MRGIAASLAVVAIALAWPHDGIAAERFGRKIIDVSDKAAYKLTRVDDINFPYLDNDSVAVSCIVYRGTQRYYVEISVTNKGYAPLYLAPDAIAFVKEGYTAYRTSGIDVARGLAADAAGMSFQPTPAPEVGSQTSINLSETTVGGSSYTTGTVTTEPSASQAGANIGNAIGNALAARRFVAAQSEAARFANFVEAYALEGVHGAIEPGETQIAIATFEQVKMKRAPFEVTVGLLGSEFRFRYRESN